MMQEVGFIDSEFWFNPQVQTLSLTTKTIVLYCYTSVHTTPLGCFRLPLVYAASDLQVSQAIIREGFAQAEQAGLLIFDETFHWLLIPSFLKENKVSNLRQWKTIHQLLSKVPRHVQFYQRLIQSILIHVSVYSDTQRQAYQGVLATSKAHSAYQKSDQHTALLTQCSNQTTPKTVQLPAKTLMQQQSATRLMPANYHWENNHVTHS